MRYSESSFDEDLARRLPLPLAKLYRRANNAKNPLDHHLMAFDLWEASLKLLGSTAIVSYSERGEPAPELVGSLARLARPTLGDWWQFVRLLVPLLADGGNSGFCTVRDLILGRARDDMPRATGLDAVVREVLDQGSGARVTVRLSELFERLVNYRNRVLGHGAPAQRSGEFHDRMGRAILAGVSEVLARLDVLAGKRMVYVADVHRQTSGSWLVERYELVGEAHRRLEPMAWEGSDTGQLPSPGRVYLEPGKLTPHEPPWTTSLHPLLIYDLETGDALLLNARRGRQKCIYLCYSSGRERELPDLGIEPRELLARVLGMKVDARQVEEWTAKSVDSEGPPPEPAWAHARSIGEFEILGKLGQGGMGVVYRAWQPSIGRQVALKCLLRSGDAKAEARFKREIRALGRVEHPNLVKIYTSGAQGDDWFYAMDLVEGATLAAVTEALHSRRTSVSNLELATWKESLRTAYEEALSAEKPLSENASDLACPPRIAVEVQATTPIPGEGYVQHIVDLLRQVAEAAHALNEAGVIHRDIKPGNIIISPDGTQAVLMDLGLAQLADELDGRLTRTRQFVGTLRYASPEQVLAVDRIDRRSDVYSLGAMLWELMTLRPLYRADDNVPTPELMRRIQYAEPGRLTEHHPAIPADLEAIVLKCLEKDPSRRYPTTRDLANDLGRWLRGEPVRAQVPTFRYRLGKIIRRHRIRIGVTVAVVALQGLIVAGVFLLSQNTKMGTVTLSTKDSINPSNVAIIPLRQPSGTANLSTSRASIPADAVPF